MIDTQIKREKCATKFCPNIGLASYFYSYHRHNPYIYDKIIKYMKMKYQNQT